MPRPNLPFNGLHLRNPCKFHGSLLTYRPRMDGRLSWPSWLTHRGRLTHEVVTRQPWIRRRSGKVRQLQTDVLTTEPRGQLKYTLTQCRVVLSTSYSGTNIRTKTQRAGHSTERLPRQHRLPSNWATNSEFYDRIFKNADRSIKFKVGIYLHNGVMVT